MLPSKYNSQRTSSHKAFEESLEALKQLSTENQTTEDANLSAETLAWDDAADDIESFFRGTDTLSS